MSTDALYVDSWLLNIRLEDYTDAWKIDHFLDPRFFPDELPDAVNVMAKSLLQDRREYRYEMDKLQHENDDWRCGAMLFKDKATRWLDGDDHACADCEGRGRPCIAVQHGYMRILPLRREGREHLGPDDLGYWVQNNDTGESNSWFPIFRLSLNEYRNQVECKSRVPFIHTK